MSEPGRQAVVRDLSIDLLRGAVMVLMALDHTRDFFGARGDALDLATTTVPLYFTRWITHFCAPVFVLLAGVSARFAAGRRTPSELSRFLLTRGLWLVFLELTVVRFGWLFNLNYRFSFVQVIWALGWSMVAMSALVRLPEWLSAGLGAALVLGHNALDGVHSRDLGRWSRAWTVLHEPGTLLSIEGHRVYVAYPLIPWVGVMVLGWSLGRWWSGGDTVARRRHLAVLGAAMVLSFVALRVPNLYGDPSPWSTPARSGFTALAVLNCEKYPPSLSYLLMTLGPAMLALAAMTGLSAKGPVAKVLLSFGRVPLFYYLLHLPLIHGMAVLAGMALGQGRPRWGLLGVYAAWGLAIAVLALPCRWFEGVKARRTEWWLRYL